MVHVDLFVRVPIENSEPPDVAAARVADNIRCGVHSRAEVYEVQPILGMPNEFHRGEPVRP
jgi:hypothetical protein